MKESYFILSLLISTLVYHSSAIANDAGSFNTDWKSLLNQKNPNEEHSICSLGEKKLNEVLSENPQPEANQEFITAISKSNVIVAGEIHLYTDFKARSTLIRMVKAINGPNVCVALELPNWPEGLNSFFSNLKKISQQYRKDESIDHANVQDDLINYYESTTNYALSMGLKVKPVDHPKSFEENFSNVIRNQYMSNSIVDLIQTKECDSVLFFVGKAHEIKSSKVDPAISPLLNAKGLLSTSVNLQMSYEYAMPMQTRTWSLCRDSVDRFEKKIQRSVLFNSNKISETIKLAPESGENMKFSDFDFTWLIPFQEQDISCVTCAPSKRSNTNF